jgi:hypothetical protein
VVRDPAGQKIAVGVARERSVHPGSDLSQSLHEGEGAARPHVSGVSQMYASAQTAEPRGTKMRINRPEWQEKAKGVPIC